MVAVSFSKTYHAWLFTLKQLLPSGEYPDYPVAGGIIVRGTDFESGTEIESEDFEGHTGTDTLVIQSDRTKAVSAPQYKHGVLFGECIEEYCYMVTGSHDPVVPAVTGATTAKKWRFFKDVVNPKPLPVATLINQYAATLRDARIYDNAMMDELGIELSDNGWEVTCNYKSDAEIPNQPNQPRTIAPVLRKLGKEDVKIYVAPVGVELNDSNKADYEYDCALSNSITLKNNLEDSDCLNTPFGKNVADKGKFEIEGDMEIKWNPKAAFLEDEWYTGQPHGVHVTTESLFKQILIEAKGGLIETVEEGGDTIPVHASFSIHLPKVEITNVDPGNLSGDDKKTLKVEYQLRDNNTGTPIEFNIISDLAALHYGTQLAIDTSKVGDTTIDGVDLSP